MAQILDPLPKDFSSHILCCYVNASSRMHIARITNIPNWYFERVVFPGQRLVFEAPPEALLEIHKGSMASAILGDTIPCDSIQIAYVAGEVDQKTLPTPEPAPEPAPARSKELALSR